MRKLDASLILILEVSPTVCLVLRASIRGESGLTSVLAPRMQFKRNVRGARGCEALGRVDEAHGFGGFKFIFVLICSHFGRAR